MGYKICQPSLVPPLATYHDYFVMAETNTFRGHYASVLHPYHIEMENTATNVPPK